MRLFKLIKFYGSFGFLSFIRSRTPFICRISNYKVYLNALHDKRGIEIGGPSKIFARNNALPVYTAVKELDGCNFADRTVWEGDITAGNTYSYDKHKPKGRQYLCEATQLTDIPSEMYEFVLSSNCLEHIANPLKAIEEWLRVIKRGGIILLVVPNKEMIFDHARPVTKYEHLVSDYENNVQENDLTHLSEILKLHDLSLDRKVKDRASFIDRSQRNYENRCLHHHLFDRELLEKIFIRFGIKMLSFDKIEPEHLVIMGQKG